MKDVNPVCVFSNVDFFSESCLGAGRVDVLQTTYITQSSKGGEVGESTG